MKLVEFTLHDYAPESIWINPDAIVTVRAHPSVKGTTNISLRYSPEERHVSGRTIIVKGEAKDVAGAIRST